MKYHLEVNEGDKEHTELNYWKFDIVQKKKRVVKTAYKSYWIHIQIIFWIFYVLKITKKTS